MITIKNDLRPADLRKKVERLWEISGPKILAVDLAEKGGAVPVFTAQGRYTTRGWTDWTLGFVYGSALTPITKAADPNDPRTAPAVALAIAGTPQAPDAWKVLSTNIAKGPHGFL